MNRLATIPILSLIGSTAAAQDWISLHNGPHNTRFAEQVLTHEWRETWRSSLATGSRVLVRDGLVVFRNNPATPGQYAALDVLDGSEQWTFVARTANAYNPGCVVGDLVLLPNSNAGTGSPQLTHLHRLDCLDLRTGVRLWDWTSNEIGNVTPLVPLDAAMLAPLQLPERVVFSTATRRTGGFDTRIWSFAASRSGPTVLIRSDLITGKYSNSAMAVHLWHGTGGPSHFNVMQHETDYGNHTNYIHRAFRFRVQSLLSLAQPSAPFAVSPTLSNTNVTNQTSTYAELPPIVDQSRHRAYMYEGGGYLRAYDLATGVQAWSTRLSTTSLLRHPLLLPTSNRLVILNPDANTVEGRSTADGAVLWSTPLPDQPLWQSGVVMEGDSVLIALASGDIFSVDADGTLIGPIINVPGIRSIVAASGRYFAHTTDELICFDDVCHPDCDTSTGPGILDIFDFLCFGSKFAAGEPYACDFDMSTGPGICDIFDFIAFQNAFAAGCP